MKLVQKKKKVVVTKAKATICGHGETGEKKKERDEREREFGGAWFGVDRSHKHGWGGRQMKKKTRRHMMMICLIYIYHLLSKRLHNFSNPLSNHWNW